MDGAITHQEYYSSLAKRANVVVNDSIVKRVKVALSNGDEHLNTIPLHEWDNMCCMDRHNYSLLDELNRRGDTLSLSTGVCMRKAIAKEQAT